MSDNQFLSLLVLGFSLLFAGLWFGLRAEFKDPPLGAAPPTRRELNFVLVLGLPWLALFYGSAALLARAGYQVTPGQLTARLYILLAIAGLTALVVWHDRWELWLLKSTVGWGGELLFGLVCAGLLLGAGLGSVTRKRIVKPARGWIAATVVFGACFVGPVSWGIHLARLSDTTAARTLQNFLPMVPEAIALGDRTLLLPVVSNGRLGNLLWLDHDARSLAREFWQLSPSIRAASPAEVMTFCFTRSLSSKVGVYRAADGTVVGPAVRIDLEAWLVDRATGRVLRRHTFRGPDPPTARGTARTDSGLLLRDLIRWLDETTKTQ